MLFTLLHNPCSTTVLTIWNETRSVRWTAVATLLPLGLGFVVCAAVAGVVRLLGGG
jgi:ferrous iron transport protein B